MKQKIQFTLLSLAILSLFHFNTGMVQASTPLESSHHHPNKTNIVFTGLENYFLTGLTVQTLQRQIEILKFEVQLLQSLLLNMQARQEVGASSYIAVRLSDNSVLAQKKPNQPLPVASVTKLMTALISQENGLYEQKITLTAQMLKPLGWSPSLYPGLKVSAENLLKASLIQSSNDAAEALTYLLGKQEFVEKMNQKAKDLGMANTVFYDSSGLSADNVSTSADLAKLVTYIYKSYPEILEITKNNDFWLPDRNGNQLKFQNVNNFYPLSAFVGGKTGYLLKAKQTFAGVFLVKEEPFAIVLLQSDNRQADVFALMRKLRNL
ncbi:MAG: S11 family D-Ala-D-Ala carboxypeptidase [Parcubacteria group bacterium Gr01-1014_30]|nr:MAG: S11 family D-Ala-D-Ala carboxypeptidase [Parcubacteria group bacterium Gr01-1014_30]